MEFTAINLATVSRQFKTIFSESFQNFMDIDITLLEHKITIDLIKFDDYLHELLGMYEDCGFSMLEILENRFGTAARALIENLI